MSSGGCFVLFFFALTTDLTTLTMDFCLLLVSIVCGDGNLSELVVVGGGLCRYLLSTSNFLPVCRPVRMPLLWLVRVFILLILVLTCLFDLIDNKTTRLFVPFTVASNRIHTYFFPYLLVSITNIM
jgi:hypothetical protein